MRGAWVFALLVGCGVEPAHESIVEQDTTVCARGETVHGMDVSSYETSIDWPTAKQSGIDFAFIRVSDGLQFHDSKFPTYWQGAHDAGVLRGAYQFFRPTQDPIAQADYLLSMTGPHQDGDLPPVIDVETSGGLAQADVEVAVRAWVDHVAAAIGRPPIVYAGYYSWQDLTGNANLTSNPLWHAQYTTAACPNIPTPWTRWTFWQYSSTGTVPQVMGETTDLDVFDGSLDELRAFADHEPDACGTLSPDGGVIDDADPCFAAGGPASTLRHASDAGVGNGLVWTKATASQYIGNFATWTIVPSEAGRYRIEVSTPIAYAQSQKATYRVHVGGVTTAITIDQTAADWQTLGELSLDAGDGQSIELADNTGETDGAQLVFDAIRLTRLDPDLPPPPPDEGGCNAAGQGTNALGLVVVLAMAITARRRRLAAGTSGAGGGPSRICPTCGDVYDASAPCDLCPDDDTPLEPQLVHPDPMIGTVLDGRFRIMRSLAEGSMGRVYEGVQLPVKRPIAIKVIREDLIRDPNAAPRFFREAQALTRIAHPNVVDIIDYGEQDGCLYLVMELLRGNSLDAILEHEGPFGVRRTCELGIQLCDALVAAHAQGVVHRDLKPANIVMLAALDPWIKVLDFGLAKPLAPDEELTSTGVVLGTPLYMSPEAIRCDGVGPYSDLYSVGCILFELLTGAPPFAADSSSMVLVRQLDDEPPPLPTTIPAPLRELIMRLLAKRPADRPASALEVRRHLEARLAAEVSTGEAMSLGHAALPVVITPRRY